MSTSLLEEASLEQAEVEQMCSLVGSSCYYSVMDLSNRIRVRILRRIQFHSLFKMSESKGLKSKIPLIPQLGTIPLYMQTSLMSDPTWRAVRGVCSAGLMTTVFPQLRAGAIFHMNMSKGKFH